MKNKHLDVVKNLRNLADSIEVLAGTREEVEAPENIKTETKPKKTKITFEDLRAVLAGLTREGKQQEVKELITKYGAKKLSDVPEERYSELLDKAREL
ncbi:rRNA biogenesis protein rrp5 [Senegalia sp. (in: firmicutes)]|uniref:rRNA biogenesis protein rrp5 n=1 Tax=Senegalia sp. (in: firmicutes) TaxID=1924098 RepID=UPI003F9D8A57